jgi:hypothetical protein
LRPNPFHIAPWKLSAICSRAQLTSTVSLSLPRGCRTVWSLLDGLPANGFRDALRNTVIAPYLNDVWIGLCQLGSGASGAVAEYVERYHRERNHQGLGNRQIAARR